MPNYPTHARWGRIGGAAMGSAVAAAVYLLVLSPVLAFGAGIGAAAATFVGAIYPDIDHHKSIPRRKAVRAFQVLLVLGLASLAGLGWLDLVAAVETASARVGLELPVPAEIASVLTVAAVAGLAASIVNPLIGIVTFRHRGWTHSVPINLVLIALVLAVIWLLTGGLSFERRVTAVVVTGTFFVGTLIHLGLDGEIF